MGNRHDLGAVERLVLASLGPDGNTMSTVAERLGHATETIEVAVSRLARDGLVETADEGVALTRTGRLVAPHVGGHRLPSTPEDGGALTIDVGEVARSIESVWAARQERRATVAAKARDERVSDDERDSVAHLLAEAFSQGRLTSVELEERVDLALSARTRGQLDDALQGLGGLQRPARSHPVRRTAFLVLAVLSSPFVMLGTMLAAFGVDFGDRVGGILVLVLLLPGLFALRRWAWPQH